MTPRSLATVVALASLVAATSIAEPARAQPTPKTLTFEATGVLGEPTGSGWHELSVRVTNEGNARRAGVLVLAHESDEEEAHLTLPFDLAPGSTAVMRAPTYLGNYGRVELRLVDEGERVLETESVNAHAVGAAGATLLTLHERIFVGGQGLRTRRPQVLPETGELLLPERAAAYSSVSMVLAPSAKVVALQGAQLDALAGFVLAGGTLAITPSRPEDLRHPTLVALLGAEARQVPFDEAHMTIAELSGMWQGPPHVEPTAATRSRLASFAGGNLRPSFAGATASYGLGEVHVLGFDPDGVATDDPWTMHRIVHLVARAHDRRGTIVQHHGGAIRGSEQLEEVRRLLDPNESSRWAIAVATLLLGVYALLAGPFNFASATRKGKPLLALPRLVAISAGAFALVVALGAVAKGVSGRARHLTLIEAGAGMSEGTARRWRGLFTADSRELTVRGTHPDSVLGTTSTGTLKMRADADALRLVDLPVKPWQTIVVREDGFAALGEGIAIQPTAAGDVIVKNRVGRDLRAVILRLPGGSPRYFPRIADGERVAASAGREVGRTVRERPWIAATQRPSTSGVLEVRELAAEALGPIVDGDAPGLAQAWKTLELTADRADWLPLGVAVLLAQIDGGEGVTEDAGLAVDSARVLVRVLGFGGDVGGEGR